MAFRIVRNDITKMNTEAIVNTANAHSTVGTGCDSAIYQAAGYEELKAYRREKIGYVPEGEVFLTPGFQLPAKYIIHAVSPLYLNGEQGEEEKLRSCYRKSLQLAQKKGIRSIAFPLISTGGFGYPKEEGMRIAVDEINTFLLQHDMDIYLVVFSDKAKDLGKKLYPGLEEYIDRNYVEAKLGEEYGNKYYPSSAMESLPMQSIFPEDRREADVRREAEERRREAERRRWEEEAWRREQLENGMPMAPKPTAQGGARDGAHTAPGPAVPLGAKGGGHTAPGPAMPQGAKTGAFPSGLVMECHAPANAQALDPNEIYGDSDAKPEKSKASKYGSIFRKKESTQRLEEHEKPVKPGVHASVMMDAGYPAPSMEEQTADYSDFDSVHGSKLEERMRHLSDTFSEYLLYLIQEKNMTNAEVYKRAIVDKKVFSKIKNNADYHPQKLTAMCLCVGAKLNLDETRDLLARAGYALSPCDKTDVIFSFFIENEYYDMIDLDIQLEEHGLPCIIS